MLVLDDRLLGRLP